MTLNPSDRFYFYQSAIGDLERIVMKHVLPEITATPGFLTNAFGVKVNPRHLPSVIGGREGIEPPPIPANWHADLAEFGSALRAVDLAKDKFTVVELGCGWGCWLNITGIVAKRRGLQVNLVGVEGDAGHVKFAHQALQENGFKDSEYSIHHGIAGKQEGYALFPIQEQSGVAWGLEARFDVPEYEMDELLRTGRYQRLKLIPLSSLLPDGCDRIDLLHVDIQGAEIPLLPSSIPFLNDKVVMVLVGTHSKQIEADLFESFLAADWVLEVERPAVLAVGRKVQTLVDGVQLWRNPRFFPDEGIPLHEPEDYSGKIEVAYFPETVRSKEEFSIKVNIINSSGRNWYGSTDNPVLVSYHWRREGGDVIEFDGVRSEILGGMIISKTSVSQEIRVLAPVDTGRLILEVTLVHEGVSWFESKRFVSSKVEIMIQ